MCTGQSALLETQNWLPSSFTKFLFGPTDLEYQNAAVLNVTQRQDEYWRHVCGNVIQIPNT